MLESAERSVLESVSAKVAVAAFQRVPVLESVPAAFQRVPVPDSVLTRLLSQNM